MKLVSLVTFCYVSYLKSLQKVSFVIIQIKEVEDMFDIFYRVDVPVNIYIMIIGVNGSHQLGILAHFTLELAWIGQGFQNQYIL